MDTLELVHEGLGGRLFHAAHPTYWDTYYRLWVDNLVVKGCWLLLPGCLDRHAADHLVR